MVIINLEIVDLVIIESSLNSYKLIVTGNKCKYYLKTRWTKNYA